MTPAQFDQFSRALTLVSLRCYLPISTLDSRDRKYPVMRARHILIYLLRHHCRLTLQQIAALMNRHHGAIYHSLRSLQNDMDTTPSLAAQVHSIATEFAHTSPASHPSHSPHSYDI